MTVLSDCAEGGQGADPAPPAQGLHPRGTLLRQGVPGEQSESIPPPPLRIRIKKRNNSGPDPTSCSVYQKIKALVNNEYEKLFCSKVSYFFIFYTVSISIFCLLV